MKNDLHDAFGEIIFDKLSEWKNNVDKEFNINLVDVFWLMHLDFEHFASHLRPTPTDKKRNAMAFREDINSVKSKILEHYSRIFEDDFQNYQTSMLDRIESEFSKLNLEKFPSVDNELLSKILELVKDVKILSQKIIEFRDRYGQKFQTQKFLSPFSDIEKWQVSLPKDELSPDIRKHLIIILENVAELKDQIRDLTLNHDEDEFRSTIKFCEEHAGELGELGKGLKDCLIAFYYLLDVSFNVELILIFLFGEFDSSRAGSALRIITERHEKFFMSLYNELKKFSSEVDTLLEIAVNNYPRAISEEYYQCLPKFSPPDEPRAILFKLRKLINLYNFYCKAQNISKSHCVEIMLRNYEQILTETRFTEFRYAPMWGDLSKYVMNFFGLNQSDLAKILGVGDYSITRKMNDGTLVDNHKWAFQAATDFSYTYLLGETTIPYYGKNRCYETKYLVSVAIRMAYAEMFLNYIDALIAYREKITNTSSISKSKFSSKNEYNLEMSKKIQSMVKHIQEMRVFLNGLDEQKITFQNDIPNELLEVSERLKDNLLHALEICANTFKHPVFDCRTLHDYEKIKTAKDKLERAKSKRNEAYDLDKADERIEKLERIYDVLKKEFELRPKKQLALLEKLERCLCE